MAHIHTKPGQYDHTISIYLIRTDFNEPKMMLHFHKKMNAYAQFGGHIELSESPWQAAAHELREESGYTMDQLRLLQPEKRMTRIANAIVHPVPAVHATMSYPQEVGHFHTDSAYAIVTNQEPKNTPREGESTDIRLFTRAEIATSNKIDTITRDIALYVFDECLAHWQLVPAINFN